jgi:uncharacterized secreted protein with C-terminal beta-propeller domain
MCQVRRHRRRPAPRRHRELGRAIGAIVHSLESRLHLSAGNVWVIKGDLIAKSPSEAIVVSVDPHDPSTLRATINGAVVASRAVAGLKQIQIGAGRGADLVSVELGDEHAGIDVRVWGGRGNDTILGDSGDQCIFGGPGDDVIDAAGGDDTCWGNNGDDDLMGGDDADWLCGDAGDDTVAGNWGSDRLLGAAGDDFLDGGEDRDKVNGGADADTIKGGGGRDNLNADDGEGKANGDLVFVEWGIDGTAYNTNDRTKRENTRLPVSRVSGDQLRVQFRRRAIEEWEGSFGKQAYYWASALCGPPVGMGPPVLARGSQALAAAGALDDHSSTNVQEVGVDEADVVETDGRYIYSLTGFYGEGRLVITDTQSNTVVARHDVPGSATGLYLIGDRLTVLSWEYDETTPPVPAGHEIARAEGACTYFLPHRYRQQVNVTVLDVSNPHSPKELEHTRVDGAYLSSRAIGDRVYLVVSNNLDTPMPLYEPGPGGTVLYESREDYIARLDAAALQDALPGWTATDARGRTTSGLLWNDDNVYLTDPQDPLDQSFLSVALIDVGDDTPGTDAAATVTGYDGQVYASQRSLYIAQSSWWGSQGTDLFKFTLGADSVDLSATIKIDGGVINQFSMDEEGDYFRVATQSGGWSNPSSAVQVLDQVGDDLRVVGSVGDIAPGESMYAARFVGSRAYLITFEQVDPLITIDLSDPSAPKVAGELVIPGFSRYLQPIDETHLVGLGRSVENSRTTGIQLSLFDVADIANPKRVGTYDIPKTEGSWQYSVADYDHHAFSYFPAQGVLAFPITLEQWEGDYNMKTEQRLEVVTIDPTKGFTRLGAIVHDDDEILRSVRIGQNVFSIGSEAIKVANLDDPSDVLATIELNAQ